jgi:hypothetical protein
MTHREGGTEKGTQEGLSATSCVRSIIIMLTQGSRDD